MATDFLREFLKSPDWQEIQVLLNETTSATVLWVVGSSGESVQRTHEGYPQLCRLIRGSKEGLRRCKNSHYARFQEVKRTHKPVLSACYCGLLGFALPLTLDGELIGVAGGCHQQAEFPITMEKCAEIALTCNIDIKEVMDHAKNIKHIPKVEQKRFLDILSVFAGMIAPLMRWMSRSLLTGSRTS